LVHSHYLDRSWSFLIFDDEEEYEWAINLFSEAIQADPKNAIALNNRAVAYHELGDNHKALSDLESAVRFAPNDPTPREVRANIYREEGRYTEAIDEYTQAIAKGGWAYHARASVHAEAGDYQTAITDLCTVLRGEPRNRQALLDRAVAYKKIGDIERYAQDMEAARLLYVAQYEANIREWQNSDDD
jgi:Flp pilus assembly protein TadD